LKAGPFRVKSTITSGQTTIDQTAEMILPDRFHLVTQTGQTSMEFIIVGTKTYQKTGNTWSLFPVDVGTLTQSLLSGLTEETQKGITDVKFVGTEAVNGKPARVYTFASSVTVAGQQVNSTIKMWVDVASGLPVKDEIQGEYAGIKSKTAQQIEYDKSIKIEAPIP